MKVNAIKCKKCGDIVYSRARHDCRGCSCGAVYIDGGFDYTRIGGDLDNIVDLVLEIKNVTKEMLFKDWNESADNKDKYGLLKQGAVYPNVEVIKIKFRSKSGVREEAKTNTLEKDAVEKEDNEIRYLDDIKVIKGFYKGCTGYADYYEINSITITVLLMQDRNNNHLSEYQSVELPKSYLEKI